MDVTTFSAVVYGISALAGFLGALTALGGGVVITPALTALLGLLNIWFHGPVIVWSLVLTRLGCALLAVATLLIIRAFVPRIMRIPTRRQWLSVQKELLRSEAQA